VTKHIGIVACSAEGASLCYRTICIEGEKLLGRRYAHPEVTMHTFSLSDYMQRIEAGDWERVANLMLSSADKVAKAGADFAICPDNTIHRAFDLVVKRSPIRSRGFISLKRLLSRQNEKTIGVLEFWAHVF
jgi:aspartate racemase